VTGTPDVLPEPRQGASAPGRRIEVGNLDGALAIAQELLLRTRPGTAIEVRGLGLGDDYIVKTASPAEVVARVKTVLRRARSAAPPGKVSQFLSRCARRPTQRSGAS
jgi:hypothetical protein